MAAQRENSPARPSDIPQKQLQNRRRPNDLHTFGMLRPSHRVANRAGLLWTGSGGKRLRCFQKHIPRYTAVALDHFGCIAREVTLQNLKNATRIFQRDVPFKVGYFFRPAASVSSVAAAKI